MGLKSIVSACGFAALAALSPGLAQADAPTLSNLLPGDYDSVVKEFSANFAYSSVTPASSLGGLGGFELGLVGGETSDPSTTALVLSANPSQNFPSHLYHLALLGRLGLPYGLTAEALVFPKKTISGNSLQQYGGALQWTLTDSILDDLPLNISTKFSLEKAKVDFTQNATVSGTSTTVPVGVDFSITEWQLQALASIKLLIFEPYVGVGYVHSDGTLSLSTSGFTVNFFNVATFPVAAQNNSAESIPTSVQYVAGTDIRLAFFTLGAEYMRVFGTSSYTGRLSFRF